MAPWRQKLHEIIFEADTRTGKAFDIALLVAIILSIIVVMLDSVVSIHAKHSDTLLVIEWVFTALFTVEYVLRLVCTLRPRKYALSFFGVVDLLALLPTYLELLLPGVGPHAMAIRTLRLVRVFRVLKLARMLREAESLKRSIFAARSKIAVFLTVVLCMVVIMGAAMHLVEGRHPDSGFTSIPQGVYWAIVTMTTVGFGDVTPVTTPGKVLASIMIIIGYSLIIVPTSIVTAELTQDRQRIKVSTQVCPHCTYEGHDPDAVFCKRCGHELNPAKM